MTRILVCGSRDWVDVATIRRELARFHPCDVVIHGGCGDLRRQRGADVLAGQVALEMEMVVEAYPVDHDVDGPWPAAGPKRNVRMLKGSNPDVGVAFGPLTRVVDGQRRGTGTGDMVRRMCRAGLVVRWIAGHGHVALAITSRRDPMSPLFLSAVDA